jgi:putative ABC transport system permease protein
MQIQPILAALRRHRLATMLIALEIALACAVLCNACFLIANRLASMNIDSGVDEASLATISLTGYEPDQVLDLNARVLSGLRAIAGVQSVSVINAVPFGEHAGTAGITLQPQSKQRAAVVHFYVGGPGSFQALGLKVEEGQAPRSGDYQPMASFVPSNADVLVTRSLAERLWPGADAMGKDFWVDKFHFRVVGVMPHLSVPAPGIRGPEQAGWSVFVPGQPGEHLAGRYLLRADPAQLPRVLREARDAIKKIAPDAVLDSDQSQSITDMRHRFFQNDRAMAGMLVGVIAALLLVTALGIVGLASFWVAQRRKQIGVRRALGATRGDILHYFQTENFLIVTFGIVLGMVMAFGLNLLLMQQYELPRLPFFYLPVGALALWVLGQLAVLAPALRAAAVPPVVATRSV